MAKHRSLEPPDPPPELAMLTAKQFHHLVAPAGYSLATVYRMARTEEVRSCRVGSGRGQLRFFESDALTLAARLVVPPSPEAILTQWRAMSGEREPADLLAWAARRAVNFRRYHPQLATLWVYSDYGGDQDRAADTAAS